MGGVNPWLQSIQAGINDKSFENAYDAQSKEDLQRSQQKAALEALLKGKQGDVDAKKQEGIDADALVASRTQRNLGTAQQFIDDNALKGRKVGASIGADGQVNLSQNEPNPLASLAVADRQLARKEKAESELSKRYEKMAPTSEDLRELENRTNTDGKGGVLTNPDAKLMSTGRVMSNIPTPLLGLGEMLGVVPKGTVDERKILERAKIDYMQSKSGMRVTPEAAAREQQAMGWTPSGDPDLVAKGVRAMAHSTGAQYGSIQGGYEDRPDVLNSVHKGMGGDPGAMFRNAYQDPPINQKQDPAAARAANNGLTQSPQVQQPASQGPAPQAPAPQGGQPPVDPQMQRYLYLKQKHGSK